MEHLRKLHRIGLSLAYLVLVFALTGCATGGDFQKLLEAVPANCHTTIDAQVSAGVTGLGGSGHFTQECWPAGTAPAVNTTTTVSTPAAKSAP